MLLRVARAGKAWIACHWMTEKKSYITLVNQWRSCNFDKLRKEESSLSYRVVASENEGSRPSCEWKWGGQVDWKVQPFSQNHNPHCQGDRKPKWSAQIEPPTVTKTSASKPGSTFGSNACADLGYRWTRARPSASTPTRMPPNAIKTLHNLERCWQRSCSWSCVKLHLMA